MEYGGRARVAWTYGNPADPKQRDRIIEEIWPCGTTAGGGCHEAKATIEYDDGADLIDILGQRTVYRTAEGPDGRHHIDEVKQYAVPVVEIASDDVPVFVEPVLHDLTTKITSRTQIGQPQRIEHADGSIEEIEYQASNGPVIAPRAIRTKWTGADGETRESRFAYDVHPFEPVSITRNGTTRQQPVPYRDVQDLVVVDDEVSTSFRMDTSGRTTTSTVAPEGSPGVTSTSERFADDDSLLIRRGLVKKTRLGVTVTQELDYATSGSGVAITRTAPDGANFIQILDAAGRPVESRVEHNGAVLWHERIGYDASGNPAYAARYQTGIGWVEETAAFDPIGRVRRSDVSDAMVDGQAASLVSTSEWDLANRMIVSTGPAVSEGAGPRTEVALDALGRTRSTVTAAGEAVVNAFFGYDIRGAQAWQSDGMREASYVETDSLGRVVNARSRDGVETEWSYNEWDQRLREITRSASGAVIAASAQTYTSQGSPRSQTELIDLDDLESGRSVTTVIDTTSAGAAAVVEVTSVGESAGLAGAMLEHEPVRVATRHVDGKGQMFLTEFGSGIAGSPALERTVSRTRHQDFVGQIPRTSLIDEPLVGATYRSNQLPDALGRVTQSFAPGDYETAFRYDEAGNVLGTTAPGMNEARAAYDSRGLSTETRHPDGAAIGYTYGALGALASYRDESGQTTTHERDGLGRSRVTSYVDGTTEETRYEFGTGRVVATKDRADQWLSYEYADDGGRLLAIYSGETPAPDRVLVSYEYDGGRLTAMRNRTSAIEFSNFDGMGRPQINRTILYADDGSVAEQYVQAHRWNAFGELERWSMPAAGTELPLLPFGDGWRTFIHQSWDVAGNLLNQRDVVAFDAAPEGEFISQVTSRGQGRISERRVGQLITSFGYDDGSPLPQIPGVEGAADLDARSSGAMRSATTSSESGVVLAGAFAGYDATSRLAHRIDVGSGDRISGWKYDARGRLSETVLLANNESSTGAIVTAMSSADFLLAREVVPAFTNEEMSELGPMAFDIGRLPWSASEGAAHQIASITRQAGAESITSPFTWEGGRRTSDGRWTYSWDALGRLLAIESSSDGRRIEYRYDPMDRLVQRIALRAEGVGWVDEDRGEVLSGDGLPARTTFIWDPTTDRLVSMYASSSVTATDPLPSSRLLRQYVHGDRGYDDPIEVLIASSPGAAPRKLHPIIDVLGGGSIEAVANADGTLVERILYADAYGAEPRYQHGLIVDRIEIAIEKDAAGELANVQVRAHASDRLESSVLQGLQVRAIAADGSFMPLSGVTTIDPSDPFTAVHTIPAHEWNARAAEATRLEIAILDSLTSPVWAHAPPQPAPAWTRELRNIRSEPSRPIIISESSEAIADRIASTASGTSSAATIYEVGDILFATSPTSRTPLLTTFKAAPFSEPLAGISYLRARWFDESKATFASPDPLGYNDSATLYAFCGGEPVNCGDPTGMESVTERLRREIGAHYTDLATHANVTWSAASSLLGAGLDALTGTALVVVLIADGSSTASTTRFQSQMMLREGVVGAKTAIAQWGTSAGEAIVEPGMIPEALSELSPGEIAGVIGDSTITTAGFVTPFAKAPIRIRAPRFGVSLRNTVRSVRQASVQRARQHVPLAQAGDDLFVGTYSQVRSANIRAGIRGTHTPHHVVQAAVSPASSRSAGISISIRKELHELTRTFRRPVEPAPNLRIHLARDIRDLRRILSDALYEQRRINRQLRELIRQNRELGRLNK